MGETRVDLHHLLEDLRDAYPGSLEETILTEIVANSLDSGATSIAIQCDTAVATFLAVDDGSGMQRRDLARYHDIASSSKTRGQGIGFAGVGIKLGLLLCDHVVTESRRGKTHVASRWHLASRHKAPWRWEPPTGRVARQGTAVELKLTNPLSPLLDAGFVEGSLRRHFEALLDPSFDELLESAYPHRVRFEVNGQPLRAEPADAGLRAPIEVRLPRKRKAAAAGYLLRDVTPLPEDRRGLAICTLGKTIKRGWDWLGVTPATPDRIGGLIEVPALAECLTLNKADFIRSGARGAMYLMYRKAIQESVVRQLTEWGDHRDPHADTRRRAGRPVERDLERVLVDLADEFPLLATLVERREGGQRRLAIGSGSVQDGQAFVARSVTMGIDAVPEFSATPLADGATGASVPAGVGAVTLDATEAEPGLPESARELATAPDPRQTRTLLGAGGPRKPARYGLQIQFHEQADDPELARLVESTVWVNEAHPAFRRAAASRSEGYHVALSVAMALAPLAVEPHRERSFISSFLELWGGSIVPAKTRR